MSPAGLLAGALVVALAWPARPAWRPPRLPTRPSAVRARRRRPGRLVGLAVAVITAALVSPVAVAALVAGIALWPRWRRLRASAARRKAVVAGLPDTVDLVAVALGAGLTPVLAVAEVARLAPAPVDEALAEVTRRVERGVRFAFAVDALPQMLGEPARPLATALVAGERDGVPLGPVLDVLARESRHQRRQAAEAAARRLPVRLAFPLACCVLPAFLLLTVIPLLAGALTALRP